MLRHMTDLAYLNGKNFAVVILEGDDADSVEGAAIFGIAKWRDGQFFVHHSDEFPDFPVPHDALERIRPVSREVRDILADAEYFVVLNLGPLPEGADSGRFLQTGLKWPLVND